MQYGFTGDPNMIRPNPFQGAPGFVRSIMPYAVTPMNPLPRSPIGSMGPGKAPGTFPQGRAGFPQSSPLYGGGGFGIGGVAGGMQNPVQGQFNGNPYGFGPGYQFDATQAGLPSTTTNFGMNPNIRSGAVGQFPVNAPAYGPYFMPQNLPLSPQEGFVGGRSQSMNPFAAQRNPNLEPQQMATIEKAMEQNYAARAPGRNPSEQDQRQEFARKKIRKQAETNVSPDRRQTRTGTGSVPGNPPRKRQEQYKPGLQRRQRGALGDQSLFRQRQTPRRRAASSAGEG